MKRRFEGYKGLVTGASSGLGRAIAIAFSSEGAWVGIGYNRSWKGAQQTLEEIDSQGGKGRLVKINVTDPADVNQSIQSLKADFGQIDFLVNNAAIVQDKPFALMSVADWSSVLSTNLGGVFNCSRAVVRTMIAQKRGCIVNVGSVAGIVASPGQVNYAASKGGMISMSRTMAAELAPQGIRVNVVVPGLLTEGMSTKLKRPIAESYRQRIPLARFGNPDEVARAVLFLTSSDASYIIGQTLVVDGGLTL